MQSGDPALYAMVYSTYIYLFIGVFHLALHFWKAAGGCWRIFKQECALNQSPHISWQKNLSGSSWRHHFYSFFFGSRSSRLQVSFPASCGMRHLIQLQFGRLPWLSFPRKSPSWDLSLRPQSHQLARGWFEKSAPVSQTTSFCASSGLKIFKPPPPTPTLASYFIGWRSIPPPVFFLHSPQKFQSLGGGSTKRPNRTTQSWWEWIKAVVAAPPPLSPEGTPSYICIWTSTCSISIWSRGYWVGAFCKTLLVGLQQHCQVAR